MVEGNIKPCYWVLGLSSFRSNSSENPVGWFTEVGLVTNVLKWSQHQDSVTWSRDPIIQRLCAVCLSRAKHWANQGEIGPQGQWESWHAHIAILLGYVCGKAQISIGAQSEESLLASGRWSYLSLNLSKNCMSYSSEKNGEHGKYKGTWINKETQIIGYFKERWIIMLAGP